jgi:hypothetical protein
MHDRKFYQVPIGTRLSWPGALSGALPWTRIEARPAGAA